MISDNYQLTLSPPYVDPMHERLKISTYIIKKGLGWPKVLTGDALTGAMEMIQDLTARLPLTAFVGEKRTVQVIIAVGNRVEFWIEDPEHPEAAKPPTCLSCGADLGTRTDMLCLDCRVKRIMRPVEGPAIKAIPHQGYRPDLKDH